MEPAAKPEEEVAAAATSASEQTEVVEKSAPEEPQPTFHTTSQEDQPKALAEYLKKQLEVPFNRYCVDCKKKKSTHALLWVGIYVCAECADVHKANLGGNKEVYAKAIAKEQWDDYQLRSLAYGGNKPFFDMLKEYEIDKLDTLPRHNHEAVKWYRARHIARMDDLPFNTPKPAIGGQP